MEPSSKDAEVRARVTREMFDSLIRQANARGEQLPVIVREALSEYLAKRLSAGAEPERELVLQALHDKPAVVNALLDLAAALADKPVTYRPKASKADTQRKILDIVEKRVKQAAKPPPHSK